MMERRTFLVMIAGGIIVAPFAAEAQRAKAPRVGPLGLGSAAESSPLFEALRQGLRERGWVEGQNITFEDRTTVGHYSRLPDVAASRLGILASTALVDNAEAPVRCAN